MVAAYGLILPRPILAAPRLGRSGRLAGEFHYLHQVSVDSKGNIYTGEVDTAKRIQKFIRYGAGGCSGTGSATVGGVVAAK